MCPKSSFIQFYTATYYMKCVTTFWTFSTVAKPVQAYLIMNIGKGGRIKPSHSEVCNIEKKLIVT